MLEPERRIQKPGIMNSARLPSKYLVQVVYADKIKMEHATIETRTEMLSYLCRQLDWASRKDRRN